MIAAKMMDMVMGIDIHIIQPPGPVPPIPIPHPFIGMVLDPMEFLPIIGASTYVNGMPRAQAGNEAKAIPPHIPIGGTFIKPVDNEGEIFMGSSTVVVEDEPFSRMASPVLSCSCIGMPSPPRPKGKAKAGLKLPTSVLMAIPTGQLVMVGGPPTISMMAMGMKAGMFLGGKFFNKFVKNSKAYKWVCGKAHDALGVVTKRMKNAKRAGKLHDDLCSLIGHPVDVATGRVCTHRTDFSLPGPLPLAWERSWHSDSEHDGPLGRGWHLAYDMELRREDDLLVLRLPDGRITGVPFLYPGQEGYVVQEQLRFTRTDGHFVVTDADYRSYLFPEAEVLERSRSPLHVILRPDASKIEFTYQNNRLATVTDSAGRVLRIATDAKGRIISVSAPHPKADIDRYVDLVQYRYDVHGDLVESIDALGNSFYYTYADHRLTREMDRNGLSFYFEYQPVGGEVRCVRTWGDGGIHDNSLAYHLNNQITVVTDSRGAVTTYFWNNDGQVWKTVDPLGGEVVLQLDAACHVVRQIDELQRVTSYEYDALGHRARVKYPDGSAVEMHWDEHLLVAATDQIGGSWSWTYDAKKRLVERIDCVGARTEYAYSGADLTAITDPADEITSLVYDERHQLVALSTPDGATSRWRYDEWGRMIEAVDPRGNVQTRKFDLIGNMLKIREPDGNIRKLAYDPEENILHVKDRQYDVAFEYVGMGRLAARIQAGTRVEFQYDTEEDLIGIKNEHGHAYRFELDARGNMIRESGFDGLTRFYVRDAAGQVIRVVRPGDRSTDYSFDQSGRVAQVQYWDGSEERYRYRADGEVIEATNDAIKLRFERDGLGRVLTEYQGPFAVHSEYDTRGNRIRLSSSLGADVLIRRNRMGDVEEVVSGARESDPWSVHFERDLLGLELERTLPGGVRSTWRRDRLGRPVKQVTTVGGERTRGRTYQWGVNDRLKAIIDDDMGRFGFEHDPVGNLAAVTYPDGSRELRMPDAVGNLFRTGDRKDRKYGPAGQVLEADGTRFRYDPEGNLTEKRKPDGAVWRYVWNAAGMLARVLRPDGRSVNFTYDALGRRIAKRYERTLTRWVWDGNVMLHEWREELPPVPLRTSAKSASTLDPRPRLVIRRREERVSSEPTNGPPAAAPAAVSEEPALPLPEALTTWLFEPGTFSPLAKLTANKAYGIVTDHLGTPVGMYSDAGERAWSMDLSIYGAVRRLNGWKGACPFRYPGQYEDGETGLYYNRFRYFDPEVGGYVSQDPIGLLGGLAPHKYVGDPLRSFDPFGLAETFFRAMSQDDYDTLVDTGKLPATTETSISPTKGFSESYDGVLVEFEMKDGTTDSLAEVGVRDQSRLVRETYPDMPEGAKGWNTKHARFKGEGNQINIGLGKGKGLDVFNDNIVSFKRCGAGT